MGMPLTSRAAPLAATGCLCAILSAQASAAVHRIASQDDFDRLSNSTFLPGDSILFRRGSRFAGMFSPKGRGAPGQPVIVGAYGDGDLPRIDAGGRHIAGLLLRDPSFWEVSDLEITNTDGSDADQGTLFGIYVLA